MSACIAYFVFLRRSAKNMAAKFKGRAKKTTRFDEVWEKMTQTYAKGITKVTTWLPKDNNSLLITWINILMTWVLTLLRKKRNSYLARREWTIVIRPERHFWTDLNIFIVSLKSRLKLTIKNSAIYRDVSSLLFQFDGSFQEKPYANSMSDLIGSKKMINKPKSKYHKNIEKIKPGRQGKSLIK